ncbi:LOW QUALITY PROTEIN: uncharacterized protein WCC33_011380 [Rhinophrynus dorsalis]
MGTEEEASEEEGNFLGMQEKETFGNAGPAKDDDHIGSRSYGVLISPGSYGLQSEPLKESLKSQLLKLECHFTWTLLKENIMIENVEERLYDQITFLFSTQRHRIYNLLAYIKHLKGENDEAITQLQKAEEHIQVSQAVDTDIKRTVTYSNYAWLYYHTNQVKKCDLYIKKVETICKKFESTPDQNALLPEIYGEQGWSLLTLGKKYYERAKDCFEQALDLDPENPELNSGYATAVYRLESYSNFKYSVDEGKSLQLLKRAVELNEKDTVVKALLALKYKYLGQAELGKRFIEGTPDYPYLLRYAAKFYRSVGKTDEAIKLLKKAIALTPTSGSLHHQMGLCYRNLIYQLIKSAKYAKFNFQPTYSYTEQIKDNILYAIFHFEKTIELAHTFVEAYVDLANIYIRGNQYQKAEETFQKALNLQSLTCEEKQDVHLNYGHFKEFQIRSESEAIYHYKEALLIPNITKARSFAVSDLKRMAEKIIRRDPSYATGFGLLGYAYQQKGQNAEAIENYKKALKLDPYNAEYLCALSDMHPLAALDATDNSSGSKKLCFACDGYTMDNKKVCQDFWHEMIASVPSAGSYLQLWMPLTMLQALGNCVAPVMAPPWITRQIQILFGEKLNEIIQKASRGKTLFLLQERMSELSKDTLKSDLLQLKCHFTWELSENLSDVEELEKRLHVQQKHVISNYKYMIYNILAYIKHLKGDYPEAIASLQSAEENVAKENLAESRSKYLVTYANYAWVHYYLNQFEKARMYIDKVESLFQEQKGLSELYLSDIYGEQGWCLLKFCGENYEKAKECFEKAVEANPDDPEWISGYATVVYRLEGFRGRNCPTYKSLSFELLKRAVQLNSKDSVIKALLGLKLQELKKFEEASKYIEEAIEQTPDLPYVLRYAGKFYRRAGMFEKSIHVLKKALSMDHTSGFLYHQIGLCYKEMIRRQKSETRHRQARYAKTAVINELTQNAIFNFEMVLEHKKAFVHAYFDLAYMYLTSNQQQKAEETYKKALDIVTISALDKQVVHMSYGRFLENHKKSEDEAIQHYKEGLLIPELHRESCKKSLIQIANQKIRRCASDASGYSLLGFVHKFDNNTKQAIECYKKALQLDPSNDEYLSILSDLMLKL